MKGRVIERESERKKIERKRRFLLQFLVKYPANKIKYLYYSFSYINRIFTPERESKIFGKSPKRRNKT